MQEPRKHPVATAYRFQKGGGFEYKFKPRKHPSMVTATRTSNFLNWGTPGEMPESRILIALRGSIYTAIVELVPESIGKHGVLVNKFQTRSSQPKTHVQY